VAEAEPDVAAGCKAGAVADADVAAAEEGAAATADVLEVTELAAGEDEEAADEHPATPTPATTAAAPTAARRLASVVEPIIVNSISATRTPQQHNVRESHRVYALWDDVRLATVSRRL
jgi:hypothetical protein